MEINKAGTKRTTQLGDLEAGKTFRYPTGDTLYQVCQPVGNLAGLYGTGKKSKKRKVWAANLANGNISAVDYDKSVCPCTASVTYQEN